MRPLTGRPTAVSLAVLIAALVGAAVLTACGSSGSDAVPSSRSLDSLGARLAKDGDTVAQVQASSLGSKAEVSATGDEDVSCPGGNRREYAATVTAPLSAAGEEENVNNVESLAFQATFKPLGYRLTTDVDGDVPARLEFVTSPGKAAEKRTFVTKVATSGDELTLEIRGTTACVED